jgi:hypothetical protein
MSDTTRPGEISAKEADKIASALGAHIHQTGTADLNKIVLALCAAFGMALIGIVGVGLMKVYTMAEDMAEVKAKVDVLFSERRRP